MGSTEIVDATRELDSNLKASCSNKLKMNDMDKFVQRYFASMSTLAQELAHLKNHVQYPASRTQVVQACNNMSDVPAPDKEWFEKNLPDGNYSSPADVVNALISQA